MLNDPFRQTDVPEVHGVETTTIYSDFFNHFR